MPLQEEVEIYEMDAVHSTDTESEEHLRRSVVPLNGEYLPTNDEWEYRHGEISICSDQMQSTHLLHEQTFDLLQVTDTSIHTNPPLQQITMNMNLTISTNGLNTNRPIENSPSTNIHTKRNNTPRPPSRKRKTKKINDKSNGNVSSPQGNNLPLNTSATSPFEKLNTLKLLYECGHITANEYQDRKTQLINEMTGTNKDGSQVLHSNNIVPNNTRQPTSGSNKSHHTGKLGPQGRPKSSFHSVIPRPTQKRSLQPLMKTVVPHSPPDFSRISSERAEKLSFDVDTLEWHAEPTRIKIDHVPFATGQLRNAYYLQEVGENDENCGSSEILVAKFSIRPASPASYLSDVEMQAVCAHYADLYNEHEPPLKVYYAKSWLLQLKDRHIMHELVCSVEDYLPGSYVKYSNNNGYVGNEVSTSTTEERERNTPHAFSHFTFVASDYRLMLVDIQGVNDSYTDPQIHTADGTGFGSGNLGTFGMEKFLESHRCNEVCRWLGLPSINPNQTKQGGTAAPQYQMPFGGIKKARDRITEERNTFSRSVTISEVFGSEGGQLSATAGTEWSEESDLRALVWTGQDRGSMGNHSYNYDYQWSQRSDHMGNPKGGTGVNGSNRYAMANMNTPSEMNGHYLSNRSRRSILYAGHSPNVYESETWVKVCWRMMLRVFCCQ